MPKLYYKDPSTGEFIEYTPVAKIPQEWKDKVDEKYTKPSGGIPASDIAEGVIPADDEYRLISEFTADGTNSLIARNLALKNVLIHIHATAASAAGNVTVAMMTNTNVELQGYVSNAINTADRYSMVKADREHGRFFVTQTAAGTTNGVAAVSTRVNTLDGNVAAAYIKTVSIAKVLPEGSIIKVYGIDA